MFGTYLGSGVTVQYDFGTTEKKTTMLSLLLFILIRQYKTNSQLDVKILSIILNYNVLYIYIYIYIQSAVHIYTQGIHIKIYLI